MTLAVERPVRCRSLPRWQHTLCDQPAYQRMVKEWKVVYTVYYVRVRPAAVALEWAVFGEFQALNNMLNLAV